MVICQHRALFLKWATFLSVRNDNGVDEQMLIWEFSSPTSGYQWTSRVMEKQLKKWRSTRLSSHSGVYHKNLRSPLNPRGTLSEK